MGPTNVALVLLFRADQSLRQAQERLDAAAKSVRLQERRVNDLEQKVKTAQMALREQQARAANLDLDLKSRDAHIEKLRGQQQNARNDREYKALLVEINTMKVDRGKVEEQVLKGMEEVEKSQSEAAALANQLAGEQAQLATLRAQSGEMLGRLQAEVEALRPARDAAAARVPPKWVDVFDRLADRFDGEAMSALTKPHARREEYACSACNMDLVTDVYNKLHSRDEPVYCPSCRRMLYIPEELPPEAAVAKPKPTTRVVTRTTTRTPRAGKTKQAAAAAGADDGAVGGLASVPPPEIELRAKGKLGSVLTRAQGETVRSANAAGTRPVECEVYVDDRLAGIYKGQTPEHLERAVKYYMEEAKLFGTVRVQRAPDTEDDAGDAGDAVPAIGAPAGAAPIAQPTDLTLAPTDAAPESAVAVTEPVPAPPPEPAEARTADPGSAEQPQASHEG